MAKTIKGGTVHKKASGRAPVVIASPAGAPAPGKPVSASTSEIVEIVLPNDANLLGNMLGGRVMHLIDIAGALAAQSSFQQPRGDGVGGLSGFPVSHSRGRVDCAEVERQPRVSHFDGSGREGVRGKYSHGRAAAHQQAYVTFVALDTNQQPHSVPPLILKTEDERRRYREAGERRRIRLAMRHKMPASDT